MSVPTHQKALFLEAKQGQWVVRTTETRKPGPGEIVVKLEAVALGGVEWKIQAWGVLIEKYPALLGLDGAGTVAELGEGVTSFAVGDRVYVSLFSLCASAADTSAVDLLEWWRVGSITLTVRRTVPSSNTSLVPLSLLPRWKTPLF